MADQGVGRVPGFAFPHLPFSHLPFSHLPSPGGVAGAVVGRVLGGVWPSRVMGMVQQSVLMVLGK